MRLDDWLEHQPPWVSRAIWWVFYIWLFAFVFAGAFISGIYWNCAQNDGVLLGRFQCELRQCIKDYDIYECSPGLFMMHAKEEMPFNISNVSDLGTRR